MTVEKSIVPFDLFCTEFKMQTNLDTASADRCLACGVPCPLVE